MKIRRTIACFTVNVEVTTEEGNKVPDFVVRYCKIPYAKEIKAEMEMRYGHSDGTPVTFRITEIIPTIKVMEMDIEKFIENAEEVCELCSKR